MSWGYYQPQQTTATGSTNYLCRSTGKLCPNATEYGYCKQTICNNCSEMMKTVTDCHALEER